MDYYFEINFLRWVGEIAVGEYFCFMLLLQMILDHVGKLKVILIMILQQLLFFLICFHLEWGVPGVALFVYICAKFYENIGHITFEIKKEFTIASDFLGIDNQTGDRSINTGLRCASYVDKKIQFSNILHLQDVIGLKDCIIEEDLLKPLKKSNVQTDNCILLRSSSSEDGLEQPVIVICNSEEEKRHWLQKFKHLLGILDEEAHLVWLKRLIKAVDESLGDELTIASQIFNFENVKKLLDLADRKYNINYLLAEFESQKKTTLKNSLEQIQAFGLSKLVSSKNRSISESVVESKERIHWPELVEIFKRLSVPPSVETIFKRFLGKRQAIGTLPPEKFRDFLKSAQMEDLKDEDLIKTISKYEPIVGGHNFSVVGIANYLLSDERSVAAEVTDDMRQPLSHYFIATSHNTYLTKDQLKSKSSVDMYISALQNGCKCLELDCWDGPDNKPIIYHGHTLTSKIFFKDVIVAIKEHAFCRSPYPLILSFENHCSVDQQKTMAQLLKSILGEMLYTKPIDENEMQMPSPEDLKGYIIIKAKKAKDTSGDGADEEYDEDIDDEDDDLFELENLDDSEILKRLENEKDFENFDNISLSSYNSLPEYANDLIADPVNDEELAAEYNSIDQESNKSQEKDEHELKKVVKDKKMQVLSLLKSVKANINAEAKSGPKKTICKIAKELSDLVSYCQPVGFKNFLHSLEKCKHFEMSSFSEKKALRLSKEEAKQFIEYNRRQLSRIYPSGMRVDSSNFDPVQFWNVGCQLVALNYQTACRQMHLNQALFLANSGCGYVLKPQFLRSDNITFDPMQKLTQSQTVTIQIISGHYLPLKGQHAINRTAKQFQVQIRVRGVPADDKVHMTGIAKNNGLDPVWDEKFVFKIQVPELAFISFVVTSKIFVAQYTIPYRCMARGYRKVPLLTKYSKPTDNAFLLVYIASM